MLNSFRNHYIQHGYVLIPRLLADDATLTAFRTATHSGCIARRKYLMDLPSIDSIAKGTSRVRDPLYDKLDAKLQRNRRRMKYLRAMRRKKKGKQVFGDVSGDDVWAMSERVAAAMIGGQQSAADAAKDASSKDTTPPLVPTIYSDPLMLQAINKLQVNLWMSHKGVEQILRNEGLGTTVGSAICDVVHAAAQTGSNTSTSSSTSNNTSALIEQPFMFADSPVVREGFGRPVSPSFGAHTIGANTTASTGAGACAWVFTDDHDAARMPITVYERSHLHVRSQYWGASSATPSSMASLHPKHFRIEFKPMESHMPHHVNLLDLQSRSGELGVVTPVSLHKEHPTIPKGSVLICDPHLLVGAGANYSHDTTSIYRMMVLNGATSKPSMRPPSWINEWRSMAADVNFDVDGVFPKLYK